MTTTEKAKATAEHCRNLANPSCRHCYGMGTIGTTATPVKDARTGFEAEQRQAVQCRCVDRAMQEGDRVPWLRRRHRKKAAGGTGARRPKPH